MITTTSRIGGILRRKHAFADSYLAFYSTITGLTRANWRTDGPAPRPLTFENEPEGEPTVSISSAETGDVETSKTEFSSPSSKFSHRRAPPQAPTPKHVKVHQAKMKEAFPGGWAPPRKLSRAAMDGLRWLHAQDPATCTTPVLAEKFKISPEAVRRILKSKWEPSSEQRATLLQKERIKRDEWIMRKRKEEREREQKDWMERKQAIWNQPRHEGEQGEVRERNWTRKPRGVDRNDKLSLV